jgi:hypothetical protein
VISWVSRSFYKCTVKSAFPVIEEADRFLLQTIKLTPKEAEMYPPPHLTRIRLLASSSLASDWKNLERNRIHEDFIDCKTSLELLDFSPGSSFSDNFLTSREIFEQNKRSIHLDRVNLVRQLEIYRGSKICGQAGKASKAPKSSISIQRVPSGPHILRISLDRHYFSQDHIDI